MKKVEIVEINAVRIIFPEEKGPTDQLRCKLQQLRESIISKNMSMNPLLTVA